MNEPTITAALSTGHRGYRVDYAKLKTFCRQAGVKIIDLYEPGGALMEQLISEGTVKKWRKGGRGTAESLEKVAKALSERLRWQVDWRELVQVGNADASLGRRVGILPFYAASGDHGDDRASGFRASIVAQLSKLRGLRIISIPTSNPAEGPQGDSGFAADVVLSGTLRVHAELARLDLELTDARTREILWANAYPFSEADQLRAQTAIAADVANQISRALAA